MSKALLSIHYNFIIQFLNFSIPVISFKYLNCLQCLRVEENKLQKFSYLIAIKCLIVWLAENSFRKGEKGMKNIYRKTI